MHRGEPRQTLILRVQRRRDRRKSRHKPIYVQLRPIGAAEQMFELTSLPRRKAFVAPLDQRRAAEQQALLGAGKAEIVVTTGFTETPDFVHHFVPLIVIYRLIILY